jgi:hypothetical protein
MTKKLGRVRLEVLIGDLIVEKTRYVRTSAPRSGRLLSPKTADPPQRTQVEAFYHEPHDDQKVGRMLAQLSPEFSEPTLP